MMRDVGEYVEQIEDRAADTSTIIISSSQVAVLPACMSTALGGRR
jgi:hypothetical protein